MTETFYNIVILKNLDNETHKLTLGQMLLLRSAINDIPDTPDGVFIKLAFADALINALNQKDATCGETK